MIIHFILTSEWRYPYHLAVCSAMVSHRPKKIMLWTITDIKDHGEWWNATIDFARRNEVELEISPYTFENNFPSDTFFRKDCASFDVLFKYGGLFLDLDTLSLKRIEFDPKKEFYAPPDSDIPTFNVAVMGCKKGSSIAKELHSEAVEIAKGENPVFGDTGPKLITRILSPILDRCQVPPVGEAGNYIGYQSWGYNALPEQVKVMHLFALSGQAEFSKITGPEYIDTVYNVYTQKVKSVLPKEVWGKIEPRRIIKNIPTLHLLGLFHTICNDDYTHCAFTGKVFKFPKMMQDEGWRVIEYSNGESQSACYEKIRILEKEYFENLIGKRKSSDFHGDIAVVGSDHHREFSTRLLEELKKNVKDGDIICHPFGCSHSDLLSIFPNSFHVETGIGYPDLVKDTYKIFESQAWRHYHMGKEDRSGNNYEWVIPNYFDEDEWEVNLEPGKYVAFLGRICDAKGMATVGEIARRIDIPVVVCGQGDISPWMSPNMEFRGPITGRQRSEFLRNAVCTLMPTNYIEPFGGVFAESNFCGSPVIATSWGIFPEVLKQGVNGFCCQTLREWLDAVEICKTIDRETVSRYARERYSLKAVGPMYTRAFKQLYNLRGAGWYTDCLETTKKTGPN